MSSIDDHADGSSDMQDKPLKRAPVVYGKRLNLSLVSTDGHEQSDELNHVHARTAPLQQRSSSSSPSGHTSDGQYSRSPDTRFQFGFRDRLKELDEQFDGRHAQPSKPWAKLSPSAQAKYTRPPEANDLQSVSMGTTVLSAEARESTGDLRASSPSLASWYSTDIRENSLGTPHVRRRSKRVSIPSDSKGEGERQSKSSSVSPICHAITTPLSRSSPTPPTSGEVSMVSRKGKGKAPARDVLPLVFDEEHSSAAKPTKKGGGGRAVACSKTKAPTKKERREAAFESSRIAANRPVEVLRSQEQKHSLSAFFAGLRQDSILTTTPRTELSSDPIEGFSSPAEGSTRVPPQNTLFGAPTELLSTSRRIGTRNQPLSSEATNALPLAAGDSDDEMPSVTSVIRQAGKQQRLQKIKQVIMQHAGTSDAFAIDGEEDLLVVKDDMHSVAREEAVQRRLDKVHGSPEKDIASLRNINHPSIRPTAASPQKLSRQELQELARPTFARTGRSVKAQLSKKQLDQMMMAKHAREQLQSIERREEEWVKRGGTLSRDSGGASTQTSLTQRVGAYAERGLKAATGCDMVSDEASQDESDEDYAPDPKDSTSYEAMDADENDGMPGHDMEFSELQQLSGDDVDHEDEVGVRKRHNKSGQRYRRTVVGSDDEEEQAAHSSLHMVQRDSTSSMESHTEDENDKENSAKLMYDRSDDKENKAVVRHELSPSELPFSLRPASGIENGGQRSLSLASVADLPSVNTRLPLKDISGDEEDPFLFLPSSKSPFTERLLYDTPKSPPYTSVSTLSLGSPPVLRGEHPSRINCLSLDSEYDENAPPRFKPLQPSFMETLRGEVSPEPSGAINPLTNNGFSQLFSVQDQVPKGPIKNEDGDGLSLTLDVGLKPALEVSETLKLKAENIFGKEQEYVVAAAVKQSDEPKELLYVNDHGFLTQTRPEGLSPQVYRMTPSQASKFITTLHSTQTHLYSARSPLRTLSLVPSQELSPEPQPLRRLRKRSPSPLEQKTFGQSSTPVATLNAFDILGKAPKFPINGQGLKHQKSEFVAVEAEESDEDDMFGFGGLKKHDNEEEEEDQDKIVEGLVDDAIMDAETEAAELVQEKFREHEEEDDRQLQKLHQDAVDGKLRFKRRGRGIDLEDDSEEDEDEDARRIRQRMFKKRKIEDDSLEALGQHEETRAFYNTYHQDLIDEDDEFINLREDVTMRKDDIHSQAKESEERETVSVDEIRQRVRAVAQNNHEVEVLDPEDTSWIDRSMMVEADDAVRIKVVEHYHGRSAGRRPNVGHMEFEEPPKGHAEDEQERQQMKSWARNQSNRCHGTGRLGNSAAITGQRQTKAGGGPLSMRSMRSTRASSPANMNGTRKTKISSLLSTVPNRKDRFA